MKILLLLLWVLIHLSSFAEDVSIDTVHIGTVDIIEPRLKHFSSLEKHISLDSAMISRYDGKDLAHLLQKIALVNVSSNGSLGALSSVSMRGASAIHTSVNWNGIPINTLTTGTTDLSLIDAGSFDQVDVIYGASGSLYGSGTLGGAIELSNSPKWKKSSQVCVSTQVGSFSNYKYKLRGKYSNHWVSYSGQAYYKYGENDFTYQDFYDFGKPVERLNHNQNRYYGTVQDLHFKFNNHFVDMGAWYQVKDKNIAGLMGIGEPKSNQQQRDSSLRVYVGWKYLWGKVRIETKSAYLYDFLRYTDKETQQSNSYKIFSEISSERWLNDLNIRWYASEQLSVDAGVKYNLLLGSVLAYGGDVLEKERDFLLAAKYSPHFGSFILSWSKEWNSEVDPPHMYSMSALIHICPDIIDVRFKLGTHYRRPTFNERYWIPGGKRDLQSENGRNFELGTVLLPQKIWKGLLDIDLNLYQADNENSIAWRPDGSVWSAVNTGEILTRGAEIETNYLVSLGVSDMRATLKYGYNNAFFNDKNSDRYKEDLAYRPHHIGKFAVDYERSKWRAGLISTYRSHAKTWEKQKVDGNFLVDLNAGYSIRNRFVKVKLSGRVENMFNKSYELVRFYPMPGRAFYFGADFIF